MKTLSSRQNALVARCRAIVKGEEPTLVLLDGAHLVSEALAAGVTIRQAIVSASDAERPDIAPLVDELERRHVELVAARRPVMAAVSPVRSPSVIVAVAARPRASDRELYSGQALVVFACDIQDPGNVGAIARVAEAAGASGMIAAGQSADPFGWKALRGSMGSALRLPVSTRPDTSEAVAEARRHGCRIVATTPRDGQPLFDADLRGPLAVLVGGEGSGLPDQVVEGADMRITIPMQSPVESLNAAVTAALILYEVKRQKLKGKS